MTSYEVGDKVVSTTGTALGKAVKEKAFKKGSEGVVVGLWDGDVYVYFKPSDIADGDNSWWVHPNEIAIVTRTAPMFYDGHDKVSEWIE